MPPRWSSLIGVQYFYSANECSPGIILRWGSASDADSPIVSYNIYKTTKDPYSSDYMFIPVKKNYPSDPDADRPATFLRNVSGDLTYLDAEVSTGTKYWYIVEALDSADTFGEVQNRELNGIVSIDVTPTVNSGDTIPPSIVGNTLRVTTPDKGSTIHLDWIASIGAFKYNVYRGTEKNNVTTVIGTTANGYTTTYDDVPPAGSIFYYKIKAADSCNNEAIE
jgi:hypothetical protein